MKRILSILALGMMTQVMYAQGDNAWGATPNDSIKCWENYNIFGSLANAKQYIEAYEPWSVVYTNCPGANVNLYIYGPRVVEAKIEAATDEAEKNALIDQLLELYDKRLEYFPGKEAYVKASKATDLYQYKGEAANRQIYDLYNEALAIDESELTAAHINYYFVTAVRMYKADEIGLTEVFELYNKIGESVSANTDKLNQEIAMLMEKNEAGMLDQNESRTLRRDTLLLENFLKVKGNIEITLRPILSSCDKIALVYNAETFAQNKDNEIWLRRAVRTLGAEYRNDSGEVVSCRDNPLYFEMTEALYQMNPSTEAARNMGRLALSRKEYSKAVQYFNEAIEGEVDPIIKASDYLKLAYAQQKLGRLTDAKASCLRSASLDGSDGEAYLQLSTIYASAAGQCGSNAFEKNAVYWAAIQRAEQAVRTNPSVNGRAQSAIRSYKQGIPDKTVSFQFGHRDGESYTIGCWINETVTVRFYD